MSETRGKLQNYWLGMWVVAVALMLLSASAGSWWWIIAVILAFASLFITIEYRDLQAVPRSKLLRGESGVVRLKLPYDAIYGNRWLLQLDGEISEGGNNRFVILTEEVIKEYVDMGSLQIGDHIIFDPTTDRIRKVETEHKHVPAHGFLEDP